MSTEDYINHSAEEFKPRCRCYWYEPDRDTKYADIMTGGDGEGWTVTVDCPVHSKEAQTGGWKFWLLGGAN